MCPAANIGVSSVGIWKNQKEAIPTSRKKLHSTVSIPSNKVMAELKMVAKQPTSSNSAELLLKMAVNNVYCCYYSTIICNIS